MEVKTSTYGELLNNSVEETQTETPQSTETTAAGTTSTETSEAIEQVAESTTTQEENVVSFSLGDEPTSTTPATEPTQVQSTFNWRDEIKKLDKKEVAKELGLNDFALEIDEYLAKGGKAIDYLNAKSVDYNSFSDEQIVKEDLKKQYPTFTPQQIDLMFNRKYLVSDVMEDDEKEFVALQLKADAYNSRQAKIAEQQKFKIPDTPILHKDEAYEQWKQQQEAQPAAMEQLKNFYLNHEATKKLNESKRVAVSLGEGVPAFNFSINNPEALTRLYTDGGETFQKLISTKAGEPDVAKQHLIGLFSYDPHKYSQEIFNYGMQMGMKKKLVEEGQNAQRPQAKIASMESNSNQMNVSVGRFGDRARN